MLNQVVNQLLSGLKNPAAAQSLQPTAMVNKSQSLQSMRGVRGIETQLPSGKKSNNPFMAALSSDTQEYQDQYGINRPLNKPMFLGYRDNKALYGGSKLFILY